MIEYNKKIIKEFEDIQENYNVNYEDMFTMGVEYYKTFLEESEKNCSLINTEELLDKLADLDKCKRNIIYCLQNRDNDADENFMNREKFKTLLKANELIAFLKENLDESEEK